MTLEGEVADVSIVVAFSGGDVTFAGIVAREPRVGWVSVELPPLEDWRDGLSRLPAPVRERVLSPCERRFKTPPLADEIAPGRKMAAAVVRG
jgi:hypothetical protein